MDEGANGESLPILSFRLFPLFSRPLHLSLTSFRSDQYSSVCYYHRGPLLTFQVLRLINVPLEIPIKVSPSIPRHRLTAHHLPNCPSRFLLPLSLKWITHSLAHPPSFALRIHTSSLSLADIKPGPSNPKPQLHPLKPVSYPTSPRERSTPTPLLVVERGSIHMEGTVQVYVSSLFVIL